MITRQEIINQAQSWIGLNEADGSYKEILHIYNEYTPLARGYKIKFTDPWCATFVSAVSIKCGATDIIPTECSCQKMIELHKALGTWIEDDSYTPKMGDIIFYDWADSGKGNNTGYADHVGFVEKVEGSTITVIEGNKNDAVGRRKIQVNGKYIRGYAVPKYEEREQVAVKLDVLRKGDKGEQVKTLQRLLLALGYDLKSYGVDGSFGGVTLKGVKAFQKKEGLTVDGIVGQKTWDKLLGVN